MTAPRLREQRRPPSPPDRLPPRRGGGSSPCTYAVSAAGRPAGFARPRVARRSLVRSARMLAAAAVLALSGALALPAQAQTPCTLNTGDLWCGVVTVALHTVGGFDLGYGFVDASVSTNTSDTGTLSDTTFPVGTNNYTIDAVFDGVGSTDSKLFFSLTSALSAAGKDRLVLHIGSAEFAFSDAAVQSSQHNYLWEMSGLDWSSESTVTLRLRVLNNAPVFATELAVFTLPENSAADVVVGTVTATDADDDTLTYSLEGTDACSFDIDSGTGEIKTKANVTYNYEATRNTYEMTVEADDGNGGTDTIDVGIILLDADEQSDTPDKPTLAAVPGSSTSLTATWTKPGLNEGPDITFYNLQHRDATTLPWVGIREQPTETMMTITGLMAGTKTRCGCGRQTGRLGATGRTPRTRCAPMRMRPTRRKSRRGWT